jgi:hypothetical protein
LNRTTCARACTGAVLLAAVVGAGFTRGAHTPPAPEPRRQPVLSHAYLDGDVAPRRVTLTALAARRLAVSTAPVAAAPVNPAARANPAEVRIPLSALIYDPQGAPWAYVAVGPTAYERAAVKVDRIDGDQVLVSASLRVGTPVVDAGAPELLGVEYGVGKE